VSAPQPPQLACSVQVDPSQSLSEVVSANPTGTTFCLASGTYNLTQTVSVQSGDAFVGSESNRPIINVGSANTGFDARNAANVVFENLAVENAQTTTSQLTGACNCRPTQGVGIIAAMGIQVFNVLFQGNQGNGMRYPGDTSPSYLIVGSQFIDNGSQALVGDSAGGFKATGFGTILNSFFANNIGQGIWCDVGCAGGTWTVEGNWVIYNTQGGIRYEISDGGAVIEGNAVKANYGLGGIQIVSSGNVTVDNNVAEGNQPGDINVATSSERGNRNNPELGVRENVVVEDNTTATPVNGCDQSGVTCTGNTTT
jgi:hypothetical protein